MFELLKGIRVIDLTTVVLGPYATQTLGDLGADVIKVESPGGDLFRSVRPGHSAEMGAGFLNCNRNKRSVVLDLKTQQGMVDLSSLVKGADVFVHNMRDTTARKLGVSYADIKKLNRGIIYCAASGYGQRGANADEPAYDDIIQGASGFAWLNADVNGEPRYLPTILCDKVGGLHLAMAVMAGLVHRLKAGKGCAVEAPMYESMVSFLMVEQLAGKSFVPPLGGTGYERLSSPYRRPFPTADGYISILPYNTKHWLAFLKLTDKADAIDLALVTDPVKRSESIDQLYQIIHQVTPMRTTAKWCEALRAIDVPCSPVNKIDQLFDDRHLQQVGLFEEIDHPSEGLLCSVRSPFTATGVSQGADRPAPTLGEHTEEILQTVARAGEHPTND